MTIVENGEEREFFAGKCSLSVRDDGQGLSVRVSNEHDLIEYRDIAEIAVRLLDDADASEELLTDVIALFCSYERRDIENSLRFDRITSTGKQERPGGKTHGGEETSSEAIQTPIEDTFVYVSKTAYDRDKVKRYHTSFTCFPNPERKKVLFGEISQFNPRKCLYCQYRDGDVSKYKLDFIGRSL